MTTKGHTPTTGEDFPRPLTAQQVNLLQHELVVAEDRINELIESEEKAWQTVAKLRIELETTVRLRAQITDLNLRLEGHTMRADNASLLVGQVTAWAAKQAGIEPCDVQPLATAMFPDIMAVIGWGVPTVGVQCPKCNGPARYLVNEEDETDLVCPKCPHAWSARDEVLP